MLRRCVLGLCSLLIPCVAEAAERSFFAFPTGNGLGFQVFDESTHKIVTFLEHPYRFVGPRSDPRQDGIPSRNLAYDAYFGVRQGGKNVWLPKGSHGKASYLHETHILQEETLSPHAVSTFFAPFDLAENAFVALVRAPAAERIFFLANFHLGKGEAPDALSESVRKDPETGALLETGPGGGVMVYLPFGGPTVTMCTGGYQTVEAGQTLAPVDACSGDDLVPTFERFPDQDGSFGVVVGFRKNSAEASDLAKAMARFLASRSPARVLSDAEEEFTRWHKPIRATLCTEDESRAYRQSETILRMAQVREPNLPGVRMGFGQILASLPPGAWNVTWVRDGAYATVALARAGYFEEARRSLDFFLNAAPVGKYKSYVEGVDYQVSVTRYFGSGEEEADYSGQSSPNVELDGWGLVLWAARQYVEASGDSGWLLSRTHAGERVIDVLVSKVAEPLRKNLTETGIVRADSSIWEVHDDHKRHFAYTTLTAARGFCDVATLLDKTGSSGNGFRALAKRARDGLLTYFVSPEGALGGSIEGLSWGKYNDSAAVEAFGLGVLSPQSEVAHATLNHLEALRVASGGYKRNDEGLSAYDNAEWIWADLRIGHVQRHAGRARTADGILDSLVERAKANNFMLPELYHSTPETGPVGDYAGSVPMVGYGAGAFILTMLARSGIAEPYDCGNEDEPPKLPPRACGSDAGLEGGTPPPDAGQTGAVERPPPTLGSLPEPATRSCTCHASPKGGWPALLFGLCLLRRRRRNPQGGKTRCEVA